MYHNVSHAKVYVNARGPDAEENYGVFQFFYFHLAQ